MVVGGWSKGILEFRFGPNLGLGLEAWTKLNNKSASTFVFPEFLFLKTIKEQASASVKLLFLFLTVLVNLKNPRGSLAFVK